MLPIHGELGPDREAVVVVRGLMPPDILPDVNATIAVERIREAAEVIDPAFLHSPQFVCEPLSARTGVTTLLKVETVNPIRSFKGRGADYLLHRLSSSPSSGRSPEGPNGLRIVRLSAAKSG